MVRNVVINDCLYSLSLKDGMEGKASGTCYRLLQDDLDLAVKLYSAHSFYPSLFDLEKFCLLMEECVPVLLSKYPVFDEEGNYIGCATPYIMESRGDTLKALYELPISEILTYLRALSNAVSILVENSIGLCDWGVHNSKLGKGKDLPFGLYVFDDSYYTVSTKPYSLLEENNQNALSRLIRGIVHWRLWNLENKYHVDPFFDEKYHAYLERFYYQLDPVAFFEAETSGFNTLEMYVQDIVQKVKNKSFPLF